MYGYEIESGLLQMNIRYTIPGIEELALAQMRRKRIIRLNVFPNPRRTTT